MRLHKGKNPTEEALKLDVAYWRAIAAGQDEEMGVIRHQLCRMYLFRRNCRGCPVYEITTEKACKDTPYDAWIEHLQTAHRTKYLLFGRMVYCEQCCNIAEAMADFLEGLLSG